MPITHNTIKDQSLSSEVEAWLANNKPQVLKMGESLGEIRYTRTGASNKSVEENVRTEKEREKKIKEYNKAIQKPKPKAQPKPKKVKPVVNYYADESELKAWSESITAKLKYGDLSKFSKFAGVSKNVIKRIIAGSKVCKTTFEKLKAAEMVFQFGVIERRRKIVLKPDYSERLIEQQNLVAYFNSKAKKGDFTRFIKQFGYNHRVIDRAKTHPIRQYDKFNKFKRDIESFDFDFAPVNHRQIVAKTRYKILIEAKHEALEKGLKEFKSECKHHGLTDYLISNSNQIRCKKCKHEREQAFIKSRQQKQKTETQLRNEANSRAMDVAVELGNKTFIGECAAHGETIFIVIKKSKLKGNEKLFRYKCHECKLKNEAVYRNKRLQMKLNSTKI